MDSGVRNNGLTFCKSDSHRVGWFPQLVTIGNGLVSWVGCCSVVKFHLKYDLATVHLFTESVNTD